MKQVECMAGFKERRKKKLCTFHLDDDYTITEPSFGAYPFYSKFLIISPQGKIVVKRGYTWNGCSPKFTIFGIWLIGTFDGKLDQDINKPKLYYATLVHDVLYHYYGYHGIPLKKIDRLFLEMMRERHFSKAFLYYLALRLVGMLNIRFQNIVKVDSKTREYKRKFWKKNRELLAHLYSKLQKSNLQGEPKELFFSSRKAG